MNEIVTGAFAHRIPPREPTLGELIDAAAVAYRRNDYRGTERDIDRKEAAWLDAEEAVKRYLAEKLGLTKEQINELGGLL